MFDGLKSLVETLQTFGTNRDDDAQNDLDKLHLAVAALLVHAATADGHMDEKEETVLRKLLKIHYQLDDDDSEALFVQARAREAEAVEIYSFTREVQTSLAPEGRQAIVRLMWQVAVADGVIDEFESNLVWRTAELIGVSTRDRVFLRQEVLAEYGMDNQPEAGEGPADG